MAATQTTVYQRDRATHQAAWGRPLEDASRQAGNYRVAYERIHDLKLVPACKLFMAVRDYERLPEAYRLEESLPIAVACDPGGRASLQTRFTSKSDWLVGSVVAVWTVLSVRSSMVHTNS